MTCATPGWTFVHKSCMKLVQAVQPRTLKDMIKCIDIKFQQLKIYIKILASKLYDSAKSSRNPYIRVLASSQSIT